MNPSDAFATNFTSADWVIVACYLVVTLVIGVIANRYIHNVSAYLVGGGAAGPSLNVATYIGTGLGLVTLMYASIEGFTHGFAYMVLPVINFVFVGLLIGSTGLVITKLRALRLLTIPEFFEKRFGRKSRILAGVLCAVSGIVNMGLFPKMGATFITYSTGIGASVEDPTMVVNIITSVLILFVLVYTVLGGMVSVIITDYIQFVVLSIGMALGIWFCLTSPDLGWTTMVDTIAEGRGEMMFNPVAEKGYGWVWIAFMCCVGFFAGFCWAPEASRALTAKDPDASKKTFLWSAPGQFARLAIPAFWGIAAFTLIVKSPELLTHFFPDGVAGDAQNAAAAMPLVLGKVVPSGLLGLLVAGLMAAFMSTHDSYLLCWASVISRDVISPLSGKKLSGAQEIRVTRISVIVIGIFLLAWGIWYELPESVWNYMAISGAIYVAGAGISLLGGCYWKRASAAGAWAAMLTGCIAVFGLFLDPINELFSTEITMPGLGLFTFAACAVMFILFSLLIPDEHPKTLE
jgi:solute:Na+ symporter, SSS family